MKEPLADLHPADHKPEHGAQTFEGNTTGDEIPSASPPHTPASATLGERIRERRANKGLSLSRLADIATVSKGYLHELENNQAGKPSAEVLYNIALALDTTIAYLLGKMPNPMAQEGSAEPLVIPDALEQFARQDRISEDDKRRLACIRYRDEQPKTVEDWRYLYETIKRVVNPSK